MVVRPHHAVIQFTARGQVSGLAAQVPESHTGGPRYRLQCWGPRWEIQVELPVPGTELVGGVCSLPYVSVSMRKAKKEVKQYYSKCFLSRRWFQQIT